MHDYLFGFISNVVLLPKGPRYQARAGQFRALEGPRGGAAQVNLPPGDQHLHHRRPFQEDEGAQAGAAQVRPTGESWFEMNGTGFCAFNKG